MNVVEAAMRRVPLVRRLLYQRDVVHSQREAALLVIGINDRNLSDTQRTRLRIALSYVEPMLESIQKWMAVSKEMSNFTYDITPQNKTELPWLISLIIAKPFEEVRSYIYELNNDRELRTVFEDRAASDRFMDIHDSSCFFGQRVGWYVIARLTKPKVVVETGVDKGTGAMVLCAALRRNASEGFRGQYIGTDIMTTAGYLLASPYAEFGEIRYGDSVEMLQRFEGSIDLFINDSDHSADYEYREYKTIESFLSSHAMVLSDNAHFTEKLETWARETGRQFAYFQEKPAAHWYPGRTSVSHFHDPILSAGRARVRSPLPAGQNNSVPVRCRRGMSPQ